MDINRLKGKVPDSVINQIPQIMNKFWIDTPLRLSHFLAQCGHESGNFRLVTENLNYSSDRLKEVFPKYFKNVDTSSYNRNPQKIASLIYGSRMGNGPESTGEGYKFRGRGYIQLTGKNNYSAFSNAIGEDCVSNPDLVATKYPLASAAWFFDTNRINSVSDQGDSDDVIRKVTKMVNGGTIGLADRISHFRSIYSLLR